MCFRTDHSNGPCPFPPCKNHHPISEKVPSAEKDRPFHSKSSYKCDNCGDFFTDYFVPAKGESSAKVLYRSRSLPQLSLHDSGVGSGNEQTPGRPNSRLVSDLRQLLTLKQHYYLEGGWGWVVVVVGIFVQVLSHGLHGALGPLLLLVAKKFEGQIYAQTGSFAREKCRGRAINYAHRKYEEKLARGEKRFGLCGRDEAPRVTVRNEAFSARATTTSRLAYGLQILFLSAQARASFTSLELYPLRFVTWSHSGGVMYVGVIRGMGECRE